MSGKTLNYWWSEDLFLIEEDSGWTPLIIYTEDSSKQFTESMSLFWDTCTNCALVNKCTHGNIHTQSI